MDMNTRESNSLKQIVYCHPPGFLATQQLVTDPHAEKASCIQKSQIYEKMGQKTKRRKKSIVLLFLLSGFLMIPADRGEGGQGRNKQKRHIHFFVTNRWSQLTGGKG